jgi:hypothetical protein
MRAAEAMNGLMKSRVMPALFGVLLLFLLAGCPYESLNPLGNPSESKIDENLLGRWKFEDKEKKESGLITILRFNESELLMVLEEEGKKERGMMRGFVTDIDGAQFLNLQDMQGGYKARKWIFVRYATGNCSLTYRLVNDSVAPGGGDRELSSGQLYGLIKKNIDNTRIYDEGTTLTCVGGN